VNRWEGGRTAYVVTVVAQLAVKRLQALRLKGHGQPSEGKMESVGARKQGRDISAMVYRDSKQAVVHFLWEHG
jgi:hypothetical protein